MMTTALKKSKERFETEMAELGSSRDMSGKESEAAGRISGLERKIQYATTEKVCISCRQIAGHSLGNDCSRDFRCLMGFSVP